MFIYISQLTNPTLWIAFPFMIVSIYMIHSSYTMFEAAFENLFIQEENRTPMDSYYLQYDFLKKRPRLNLFWTAIGFFCWIYWFFSTFQSLISLFK